MSDTDEATFERENVAYSSPSNGDGGVVGSDTAPLSPMDVPGVRDGDYGSRPSTGPGTETDRPAVATSPIVPSWAPDLGAPSVPVLVGEVIDPPTHRTGRPYGLDAWHSDIPARAAIGNRPAVQARTLTKRDAVMDALASGLPVSAACEYAGVDDSTFYHEQNRNPEFRQQVARVRRRSHLVALTQLQRAASDDWRAADRFLQLSDPNLFGDRLNIKSQHRIEIVAVILGAIEEAVDRTILDPEVRLRLAEAIGDGVSQAMGETHEGEGGRQGSEEDSAAESGHVGDDDQPRQVETRSAS